MRHLNRHIPAPPRREEFAMEFDVETILEQIVNLCYAVSQGYEASEKAAGREVDVSLTQDVVETDYTPTLQLTMNRLFSDCCYMLKRWTHQPLQKKYSTNKTSDIPTTYIIILTFDNRRGQVQVNNVAMSINEYVVKQTVYEWLLITLPAAVKQIESIREQATLAKGHIYADLADDDSQPIGRVTPWSY